ncbi:Glucose/ribitol dehydrogenase [Cynara cardunculus var. scolymus]|uniref:Glucose/ribitol dehydrogenase n=1 Tax=Cynara cardunculus var. scolymus TaxID=59895 RepID=A0A103XS43_CYNCS|nr:Glucose/ribitol dehydrogenase [Cynara cardunculus var. scolymus]
MSSKDLMEALHFACTLSFWRMTFLWTYSLIISYIQLLTRSMTQKSTYNHCAVSPLPPITSSASGRRLPICIITGATSGLGAAAALALSREGFCVVMSNIRSQSEEVQLKAFQVDLSSLSSIMRFKESLDQWLLDSDMHPSIQLLINNAGILATTSRLTTEGHDQMMGTNYIGAFSLTEVLLPLLKNSPVPSRIINLTSFTHRNVSGFRAEKETVSGKRFSKLKHYPCAEIYELAVDPGAVKTDIMREVPWCISQVALLVLGVLGLLQSPEAGVSSILDAALAPPETSGLYFFGGNGRTVDSSALSYDLKLSRELWATSCHIFQDSLSAQPA